MGMFAAKHYAIVGLHIEVKCYYPTCLKYRIIAILNTPCFSALSLLSGNNLEKKKKKIACESKLSLLRKEACIALARSVVELELF